MNRLSSLLKQRFLWFFLAGLFLFGVISSCSSQTTNKLNTLKVDFAYYNPISLVLKQKGWLEEEFAKDKVKIEWVQSVGSNKALEFLNSNSIDFGSTAGAASFINRANGNPIKAIYVYAKPEGMGLLTQANSPIKTVTDLRGKRVAATRGTDPFILLLRALDKYGLSDKDIQLVPLQHSDGKAALEKGDVEAWAGLDPLMAQSELEAGSRLFFTEPKFLSYGVLNVRENFAKQYPEYIKRVLVAYEKARQWSIQNPDQLKSIVVKEAKLTATVASKQLGRINFSNSKIGQEQKEVIAAAGNVLKKSAVIKESVNITQVVNELIEPQFIEKVAIK